ncbi:hypothetical protein D3C72_792410 [compost metagenome]
MKAGEEEAAPVIEGEMRSCNNLITFKCMPVRGLQVEDSVLLLDLTAKGCLLIYLTAVCHDVIEHSYQIVKRMELGLIRHLNSPLDYKGNRYGFGPFSGQAELLISFPFLLKLVEGIIRIGVQIGILFLKITINTMLGDGSPDKLQSFMIGIVIPPGLILAKMMKQFVIYQPMLCRNLCCCVAGCAFKHPVHVDQGNPYPLFGE